MKKRFSMILTVLILSIISTMITLAVPTAMDSAKKTNSEFDVKAKLSGEDTIVVSGTCGNNLTWILNGNGTLTINGIGEMYAFNVESTPWYAFCSSIKHIEIGENVTSIGKWAFHDCNNLKSITIPNSLTSIGDRAFQYCTSLETVSIPSSVTSIGECVFYDCENLKSITVDSNNSYYFSDNFGVLFDNIEKKLIQYPIGYLATSYTIPDGIISIGKTAFQYCESIKSISIPDSITSIGSNSFQFCTSLESINISDKVTSIGNLVFNKCTSLVSINVHENNDYYSSENGVLFDKNKLTLIQYPTGNSKVVYNIPSSVKTVNEYAFEKCKNLESVIIPNGVTNIGSQAFVECINLEKVVIPSTVTLIGRGGNWVGDEPFASCPKLTIHGYSGSYAETYAKDNNIPFVAIKPEISYGITSFSGTVSYTDGSPISNAAVELCAIDGTVINYVETNSNGEYTFEGYTGIGKYMIRVNTSFDAASERISIEHNDNYEIIIKGTLNFVFCKHTFDWVVEEEPTCTESGSKYKICTSCGEERETSIIPAAGHDFGEWFVTIEPTYETVGKKTRTCLICGYTETKDIDKLDSNIDNVKFTISNGKGRPNDIVEVTLSIKSNVKINTIGIKTLSYDNSILTFVGFDNYYNIVDDAIIYAFDNEKQTIVIGFDEAQKFDSDICTIGFKINENALDGTVKIDATSLIKFDYTEVSSVVESGKIEIFTYILGDLDLNNHVDLNDAILLLQYSMFPELYPLEYAGSVDFTDDGNIDMNDAILLLQHSMFPSLYPIQ